MIRPFSTFCLLALLTSFSVFAQVKSPQEFLGYPIGSRFTPHHRVLAYYEHVAQAAPDRVKLIPYGSSYEGRPLVVAVVSSAANLARLEQVRLNNLRLAGLAEGNPETANAPALVWLGYNVHGPEASGTEAALLTLHHLVTGQNGADAWLQNTVTILDPCKNPDGRERYVNFYQQTAGAFVNPSYASREHQEPWPGGRWNHYSFDLNRDWAWQSQQETQQRVALYNQWLPQIYADFHEMGFNEPYFFAPAAEPQHKEVTGWQREFQQIIGKNHAKNFDKNGWLYFTKETFDLLYPSYGDTWPTFNGALGMTYEQGGGGAGALAVITETGDTLTFAERVQHQHVAGLSTVEVAANHRERAISEFKKYYDQARTNPGGPYRSFVISADNDPKRVAELLAYLDRNLIKYSALAAPARLRGFNYQTTTEGEVNLKPGDVVVSTAQPKSVLVKVLFNPKTVLADSVTYDATAWALPYSWGVKAYAVAEKLNTVAPAPAPTPASLRLGAYAYALPWKSFTDLRFLVKLLQSGIKVRYAEKEFVAEGTKFSPGSLVITRADNKNFPGFDRTLADLAQAAGQAPVALATGFADQGVDLGSSYLRYITPPRVAIVSGEAISPTSFGEIWHYFEQQIGYPTTVVNASYLRRLNWTDFDVLVLPSGYYAEALGEATLAQLKAWVRNGGRVVAVDAALNVFADKGDFALKTTRQPDRAAEAEKKSDPPTEPKKYASRDRDGLVDYVEGSIYKVALDNTHPLAFGYDEQFYTLKRGGTAYEFLQGGWSVGTLRDNAFVDGFAGYRVKQKLKNTLQFGVEEFGRGHLIYLTDSPVYRSSWASGKLLFGNAVFLVGQ
jgi:Zinc carboxypeptidase